MKKNFELIQPEENCPVCKGSGRVTEWVETETSIVAVRLFYTCVLAQSASHQSEIRLVRNQVKIDPKNNAPMCVAA